MKSLRSVFVRHDTFYTTTRRGRLLMDTQFLGRRHCATKASTTTTTSTTAFFNPLAWYSRTIDSHPLLVKCTTACLVAGAGDVANQQLQQQQSSSSSSSSHQQGTIDWAQTARFAGMNLCVVGPTLHFWYRWLAQRYPGNSFASVAKRVVWDEFIFTPVCTYYHHHHHHHMIYV